MAIDSGSQEQFHKSHRSPHSGAKSDKSKNKGDDQKQHNPKAFAFSSSVKAKPCNRGLRRKSRAGLMSQPLTEPPQNRKLRWCRFLPRCILLVLVTTV
ncbi:Ribosome biogenesis protein like [Actinidia chinensis var. chinensis]|uniref:Ribosome biogenesis protein like n=1 Tax=Actinidia chinensis var. chinensis TaxID=1590841 RepID=A0A2R6S0E7_ACTCC|nr:Ribosome biogenesis protein like [Actinidia chinensis var. chinensis]